MTGSNSASGLRPVTALGRPMSGFARPGTQSRPMTGTTVEGAFQGARPGTSRPLTTAGRFVRLGTASMVADPSGPFIDVNRLDLKKYAKDQALSKILCNYLLYHEHNPRKALELAAEATAAVDYRDWWWKMRIGQCHYRLGLLREAEKQFKSAFRDTDTVTSYLQLSKVYVRLDQPNAALDLLLKGAQRHPGDTHILLAAARIYDALNDQDHAVETYKRVLALDPSSVEALASLAAHFFYADQPEVALRYYRRLIEMGVSNAELWNNLALSCFYASQYDLSLSCFERALMLASDETLADVWYNIGQVAVGVGDVVLAYQAFKLAVTVDPNHAEAFNNLGVLELRQGNVERARTHFATAAQLSPALHEGFYNGGLLSFKLGDFQDSYKLVGRALQSYAEHTDSQELLKQLRMHFNML
eukprot:TRINITY_DN8767_c0_g1_i1.p1 TRINITY_DN8767_c0_g1~~TRINITY_DN8767_c0_g1_i1.p1  ORF type:complete len:416 (+),score=85.46 TRINITY_DN8767_c0_g1_i1:326-1573(+)